MKLPDYFLADLPPGATLTAPMLTEAFATLRRNRAKFLAPRSTDDVLRVLCRVADHWLDTKYPFRRLALADGPAKTGFSRATLELGLDRFFEELTRDHFLALLQQEIGDPRRLDEFVSLPGETCSAKARGPELLVHIAAGNLPCPAFMSLALGLLTRSAQFMKCASGGSWLPRLFAHSIYHTDHKLGACLELAEWSGGNASLGETLLREADCVTATGSDESLAAIRAKVSVRTRFVGYGHRVSFGFVSKNVCEGRTAKQTAALAAQDVAAWDQLGCLSPHMIYVQRGGEIAPDDFAGLLAAELQRIEAQQPRGEISPAAAATIASRRSIYEMRAAHSAETQLWRSEHSTAWTVVYEAEPAFQMSCLNRFIHVKAVSDLGEALRAAEMVRGSISTVALAADLAEQHALARALSDWGVSRICRMGQMQSPPLTWRHDGRPALADLVTWTELENRT
jgi:hypothetical protein